MPLAETFRTNIAAVRAQNGIGQVNHPNYRWSVRPEDLNDIPDGTFLEIWNGLNTINNLGGADGAGDVRPSAEGYWDYLLSRGRIVWGVGSDDSHDLAGRGHAWIVVHATELTATAIRAAIEHGQFYASNGVALSDAGASDTELAVTIQAARSGARYTTRFIGQSGAVLAEVAGPSERYRFTGAETYVRASIIDSNGNRAWTQPVFRDGRRSRIRWARANGTFKWILAPTKLRRDQVPFSRALGRSNHAWPATLPEWVHGCELTARSGQSAPRDQRQRSAIKCKEVGTDFGIECRRVARDLTRKERAYCWRKLESMAAAAVRYVEAADGGLTNHRVKVRAIDRV